PLGIPPRVTGARLLATPRQPRSRVRENRFGFFAFPRHRGWGFSRSGTVSRWWCASRGSGFGGRLRGRGLEVARGDVEVAGGGLLEELDELRFVACLVAGG